MKTSFIAYDEYFYIFTNTVKSIYLYKSFTLEAHSQIGETIAKIYSQSLTQ
jgi:hypothetical protein